MKTLICFLAAAAAMFSQTTGTITGTVTDSSGAVVAGARVTAVNKTAGERREATTGGGGTYAFPFLVPGEYEIVVANAGFSNMVLKATLGVTERIAMDAVLQPAGVAEKIEVSAPAGPCYRTKP